MKTKKFNKKKQKPMKSVGYISKDTLNYIINLLIYLVIIFFMFSIPVFLGKGYGDSSPGFIMSGFLVLLAFAVLFARFFPYVKLEMIVTIKNGVKTMKVRY